MLKKLLFCLALIPHYLLAQDSTALRFAQYISVPELKKHLTYIASDELAGRRTGTVGQKKAAQYIAKHFESQGLLPIVKDSLKGDSFIQPFYIKRYFLEQYSVIHAPKTQHIKGRGVIPTENVLGFIEGTDRKDEVVVITAHYDHLGKDQGKVYNGADDDGSGTSTILALATAFAEAQKAGYKPSRSILLMTVAGEEMGLLGSEFYTEHPVLPLDKTVCNLNIDMVGRIDHYHEEEKDPNYVYVIGSDKMNPKLDSLLKNTNNTYTHLSLDYAYSSEMHPLQLYYRSDHYNFAKHNIPIIFFTNGEHDDYHKPTDDVDKIEFDILQKRAQLFFFLAWRIARGEF